MTRHYLICFTILFITVETAYTFEENCKEAANLAVIVLAFREGVYLRHCIARTVSLRFTVRNGSEIEQSIPIIVVETESNQPASFRRYALAALESNYHGVKIVYNSESSRLNVSAAMKRGISVVSQQCRPQFFLFLDDSTEPMDAAFPVMVNEMSDPTVAIVGAESRYAVLCNTCMFISFLGRVDPYYGAPTQAVVLSDIWTVRCITRAWASRTATAPAAHTPPPPTTATLVGTTQIGTFGTTFRAEAAAATGGDTGTSTRGSGTSTARGGVCGRTTCGRATRRSRARRSTAGRGAGGARGGTGTCGRCQGRRCWCGPLRWRRSAGRTRCVRLE